MCLFCTHFLSEYFEIVPSNVPQIPLPQRPFPNNNFNQNHHHHHHHHQSPFLNNMIHHGQQAPSGAVSQSFIISSPSEFQPASGAQRSSAFTRASSVASTASASPAAAPTTNNNVNVLHHFHNPQLASQQNNYNHLHQLGAVASNSSISAPICNAASNLALISLNQTNQSILASSQSFINPQQPQQQFPTKSVDLPMQSSSQQDQPLNRANSNSFVSI